MKWLKPEQVALIRIESEPMQTKLTNYIPGAALAQDSGSSCLDALVSVVETEMREFKGRWKGEAMCRFALEALLAPHKFPKRSRNAFLEGLELDGFCASLAFAFEYHGEQHYKHVPFFHKTYDQFFKEREHDMRRRRLCREHGVFLLEIPFRFDLRNIRRLLVALWSLLGDIGLVPGDLSSREMKACIAAFKHRLVVLGGEVPVDETNNEGKAIAVNSPPLPPSTEVKTRKRKRVEPEEQTSTSPERRLFEVEGVHGRRRRGGRDWFLISWKDYPKKTWELPENLIDCQHLLRHYIVAREPVFAADAIQPPTRMKAEWLWYWDAQSSGLDWATAYASSKAIHDRFMSRYTGSKQA